jgi:hypothetical protein
MIAQRFSAIIILTMAVMSVTAAILAFGVLSGNRTIPNQGNVNAVGVGVYWESTCDTNVTTIDWGYLEPGADKNVTVYICNEGNIPMTLSMTSSNWTPSSASSYMTLVWNQEGSQVGGGAVVETVLTLSVSPDVANITSFSFDITITGIETS